MHATSICTKDREHYFGDISNGIMQLSHVGVLADVFWYEIKNHAKNIIPADFVVMPNHVHGILILENANTVVETLHATSLQKTPKSPENKFMSDISPKPGSISTIIRSYKSAVTKHAHRLGYNFSWQSRFHDHIIRNEKSFYQILEYVKTNPQNWENDKFFGKDQ